MDEVAPFELKERRLLGKLFAKGLLVFCYNIVET